MEKYLVEYLPGTKWNEKKGVLYRHMECKVCGVMTKCSEDTQAVTCSICVQESLYEQFGGPDVTLKKSSGRPRGSRPEMVADINQEYSKRYFDIGRSLFGEEAVSKEKNFL